jgi:hypothetical protein
VDGGGHESRALATAFAHYANAFALVTLVSLCSFVGLHGNGTTFVRHQGPYPDRHFMEQFGHTLTDADDAVLRAVSAGGFSALSDSISVPVRPNARFFV